MSTYDPELTSSSLNDAALGTIAGRLTLDADRSKSEANTATGGWDIGVAGRIVQLLDVTGNVIATTTTDATGG